MSDDEDQYNPKSHKNLLHAISSLGKTQHIRKTTRSEPKQHQDEFQLVKGARDDNGLNNGDDVDADAKQAVGIADLVGILSGTKKHLDVGKQLRNVKKTKKVLEKPLEKPAAERIKRTVGYENVKERLSRWDAVVAKNRSSETQIFPLKSETIYIDTFAHSKPLQTSLKSQLAMELDATEEKLKSLKRARSGISEEDEQALARLEAELLHKKMTRDELRAKRKELAYMKLRESQKSAKARMQNKIKSKKYHKLMKRQKLKDHLKEFELLQKTDPEAALAKLNELEKSRVLERASLRHKNTGTWAKNLQVRAKYDKDVRKDLAEQLQISRQLTDKKQDEDSDEAPEADDDNDNDTAQRADNKDVDMDPEDPFNPWMRAGKKGREEKGSAEEMANWRQYWLDRNRDEKQLAEYRQEDTVAGKENQNEVADEIPAAEIVKQIDGNSKAAKKRKLPKAAAEKPTAAKPAKTKRVNSAKSEPKVENGWLVEDLAAPNAKSIDEIFDDREDAVRTNLTRKLQKLTKDAKRLQKLEAKKTKRKAKTKKEKDELKNLKDLSFKQNAKRPQIDEALNGGDDDDGDGDMTAAAQKLNDLTKVALTTGSSASKETVTNGAGDNIDPNNLPEIKLKQHALNPMSAFDDASAAEADYLVDESDGDDENDENVALSEQQMTISQAFEDDDIVADFTRDKTKDSELKNTEINLSMPGWGSWAGAGLTAAELERNKQRNKRLVLQLAPEEKRRDDCKNKLYINEASSKRLRGHLVSDLPFPFTALEDYEASIRAPIGRTFVPETAFRMLTRPEVITMKGKVIEPMDDSELIKPERVLRHEVDRRIRTMENAKKKKSKGGR